MALPQETFTVDIHCVTKWTKLDTTWTGVSLDTLLDGVDTEAEYVVAWCDGDYTTNLPLEDVTGGRAWLAHTYDGEPLEPRARRPGAPARAAPVLLEEREVGARPDADDRRRAGLLGAGRLPQLRRPVAGAALLERLTPARRWRVATVRRRSCDETPHARTLVARRRRLAGPPRRPARRRPADRRGRLPGAALVLDRVGAGGRRGSR